MAPCPHIVRASPVEASSPRSGWALPLDRGADSGVAGRVPRLHRRYERKAEHFLAFAGIAAALICYRSLA